MPLFDNATLTRFLQEGEDQFNAEENCIVDRMCLPVVAGTDLYVLPDYVLNIRRFTWYGYKIDAENQRGLRDADLIGTEQGGVRPYNYIFNNYGQNTIKIWPTPQVTTPAGLTDLWGADILNGVILEFYRAADHVTFVIPPFFSTPLNSAYQLAKLNAIEGRGQNLKAAKYYSDKWTNLKETYISLLHELMAQQRIISGINEYEPTALYPHLSVAKFGIGVDPGE